MKRTRMIAVSLVSLSLLPLAAMAETPAGSAAPTQVEAGKTTASTTKTEKMVKVHHAKTVAKSTAPAAVSQTTGK